MNSPPDDAAWVWFSGQGLPQGVKQAAAFVVGVQRKQLAAGAAITPGTKVRTLDNEVSRLLVTSITSPKEYTISSDADWSEMHESSRIGVNDMIQLSDLHENSLLHNLRVRYSRNEIYTYTGNILVSVNPYRVLPLYTPQMIRSYQQKAIGEMPPHLFAIGDAAYRAMLYNRRNQSIIISGESGAGKTEASKLIMQYLAAVSSQHSWVEQQVLEANWILESLGNAKTIRNDNSSRFGKFTQIDFSEEGHICGARISQYLLEKVRVVSQQEGERNYHIFYQLLAGADQATRDSLYLTNVHDFLYLTGGGPGSEKVQTIDDTEEWGHLMLAMDVLGFKKAERDSINRVVAAVIHLGNVDFREEKGGSRVKNRESMKKVVELLALREKDLAKALVVRENVIRGEKIDVPLTVQQAEASRDAIAKMLYGQLFAWSVERINAAVRQAGQQEGSIKAPSSGSFEKQKKPSNFIGLLDIFGFENFKSNSFEQMCINFTNEKLQQHFNQHIFKLEQDEYNREGIDWSGIEFTDNQACLDLIEGKPTGIVALLEEQCRVRGGSSDDTFLQKLHEYHGSAKPTPHFVKPKTAFHHCFGIDHYAGTVYYEHQHYLEKNKDRLEDNLKRCMEMSAMPFVRNLFDLTTWGHIPSEGFSVVDEKPPRAVGGSGTPPSSPLIKGETRGRSGSHSEAKKAGLSAQFVQQMNSLMTSLNATEPYFIRTIKPNSLKAASNFDWMLVLLQLRYSGMLDTIKIRRRGYPVRRTHEEFYHRYYVLAGDAHKQMDKLAPKERASQLIRHLQFPQPYWAAGHSKMFMKDLPVLKLEVWRRTALHRIVTLIARMTRGWLARIHYRRERKAVICLQNSFRMYKALHEYHKAQKSAIKMEAMWRGHAQKKRYKKDRQRVIKLQACFRMLVLRERYLGERRNIIQVQSEVRRRLAQIHYHRDYEDVVMCQSLIKMRQERKRYAKVCRLIVFIQSWKRMVKDRKAFLKWQEEHAMELACNAAIETILTRVIRTHTFNEGLVLEAFNEAISQIEAKEEAKRLEEERIRKEEEERIRKEEEERKKKEEEERKKKEEEERLIREANEKAEEKAARLAAEAKLFQEELEKEKLRMEDDDMDEGWGLSSAPMAPELVSRRDERARAKRKKQFQHAIAETEVKDDTDDALMELMAMMDTELGGGPEEPAPATSPSVVEEREKQKGVLSMRQRAANFLSFGSGEHEPVKVLKKKQSNPFGCPDEEIHALSIAELAAEDKNGDADWSMTFTPVPIKTPLLKNTGKNSSVAVSCFATLMKFMGQLGGPQSKLSELVRVIISAGIMHEEIRDEIYCQIIKQVTENTSNSAVGRGWMLLSLCASFFPPTARYIKHVYAFIDKQVPKLLPKPGEKEAALPRCARASKIRIEKMHERGARKFPPVWADEMVSMLTGNTLTLNVITDDAVKHSLPVMPWTTASELFAEAATRHKLTYTTGFGLLAKFGAYEVPMEGNDMAMDGVTMSAMMWLKVEKERKEGLSQKMWAVKNKMAVAARKGRRGQADVAQAQAELAEIQKTFEKTAKPPKPDFILRKVHYLPDEIIDDARALEIMSSQERRRIANGWYDTQSADMFARLAVLRHRELHPCKTIKEVGKGLTHVTNVISAAVYPTKTADEWNALAEKHFASTLKAKDATDARRLFIETSQGFTLFGCNLYPNTVVPIALLPNFKPTPSAVAQPQQKKSRFGLRKKTTTSAEPTPELPTTTTVTLAIGLKGLYLLDPKTKGVLLHVGLGIFSDISARASMVILKTLAGKLIRLNTDQCEEILKDIDHKLDILRVSAKHVLAVEDYHVNSEEVLSLNVGDVIKVDGTPDEYGWYKGTLNDKTGFFPGDYIRIIVGDPEHVVEHMLKAYQTHKAEIEAKAKKEAEQKAAHAKEEARVNALPLQAYALEHFADTADITASLSHTINPIDAPLTKGLSEAESKLAIERFSQLMQYMGDYKPDESCTQNERALLFVSDAVGGPKQMTDELFCQVSKQLTNNHRESSLGRGWEVATLLVSVALPSPPLLNGIKALLQSALNGSRAKVANACINRLARTSHNGARKTAPLEGELASAQTLKTLAAGVHIAEHTQTFQIDSVSTVNEVCMAATKALSLNITSGFTLIAVSEGIEQQLGPKDKVVDALNSGTDVQLIYRRIYPDISTCKKDVARANELTRHIMCYQAIREYLKGAPPIAIEQAPDIASAIQLSLAKKNEEDEDWSNVEKCVPERFWKKKTDKDWVALVDKAEKLDNAAAAESFILKTVMMHPLFGSAWFTVHQKHRRDIPEHIDLAINLQGINLVSSSSKQLVVSYKFDEVVSFNPGEGGFGMVCGNLIEKNHFLFSTTEGERVTALVQGYMANIQQISVAPVEQPSDF